MRQSCRVYGDDRTWEVSRNTATDGRYGIVNHLYEAVVHGRQVLPDGRWGKATVEVVPAVVPSAQERREVFVSHQVPVPFRPHTQRGERHGSRNRIANRYCGAPLASHG